MLYNIKNVIIFHMLFPLAKSGASSPLRPHQIWIAVLAWAIVAGIFAFLANVIAAGI